MKQHKEITIGTVIGMMIDAVIQQGVERVIEDRVSRESIEKKVKSRMERRLERQNDKGIKDLSKKIEAVLSGKFEHTKKVSTREICDAIGITNHLDAGKTKRVASVMRSLGWRYVRFLIGNKQCRGWERPEVCISLHKPEEQPTKPTYLELLRKTKELLEGDLCLFGEINAGRLHVTLGLPGEVTTESMELISQVMEDLRWKKSQIPSVHGFEPVFRRPQGKAPVREIG
jgi:hypothetical protein